MLLKNQLKRITSWQQFLNVSNKLSNHEKGELFEILSKHILLTRPEYKSILKKVWRVKDNIPKQVRDFINLPNQDEGIDLIAETKTGEFWAIQCKFKGQNQNPTYKEISTFTSLVNAHCKNVSLALLIHSAEKGIKKRYLLGNNYCELGLEFWLNLNDEDWRSIHYHIQGMAITPKPREPRPHQVNAIREAVSYYFKGNARRGKLIMPCGTGKSLTAYWIAEALKARNVVVAVPSLSLIKQSLEDWTREFIAIGLNPLPEWLVVCSDETTGQIEKDEFVSETYSLGIPTTTDPNRIKKFLMRKSSSKKVIFITYQSSPKLAEVSKKIKFKFDLSILDEAHKTVGLKSKIFATLLSDKNISITRRIFMTATERVLKDKNDEVNNMNDEAIYGKVFYQLSFKEAIHSKPQIICDYKILTIVVSNTEIIDVVRTNKLVSDPKRKIEEQEAASIAAAISLRKAYREYGINHAISFHRSIKAADDFRILNEKLNLHDRHNKLNAFHISSKKTAGERARLMMEFEANKSALMTNARCLTEGIDVPIIDCVLFADPKQSTVDIVQSAGRALRPSKKKKFGYILLPLIIPDGMSLDEFSDFTTFRQVIRIITALSTQDERIAEEMNFSDSMGKKRVGRIIIDTKLSVGLSMDISAFSNKISLAIWNSVGKANWRSFEEARKYIHSLKLKNLTDWRGYIKSGNKPKDIPSSPAMVYESQWINLGDWLGTGYIAPWLREYLTFQEAKRIVSTFKIKSKDSWLIFSKSNQKPENIPSDPRRVYKEEWISWADWLGTGLESRRLRKYSPFIEARKYVRSYHLKNRAEYNALIKLGGLPIILPSKPERIYKGQWKGIGDWLGTGKVANQLRKYKSFEDARKLIRSLKLTNKDDWIKYSKSGNKPEYIPSNPPRAYKQDWINWGDWLGTGYIANRLRKYRTFEKARRFVRKLKLKNQAQWHKYSKSRMMPKDIPSFPEGVYKKDWISMGDWLGTGFVANQLRNFRSFEKAREYVHRLDLKNNAQWKKYSKSGMRPSDIPSNPNKVYKQKWINISDWLGIQSSIS